jgi:hypothetical protein
MIIQNQRDNDMKYGLISLALSLSILLPSQLLADDTAQKICYITDKEMSNLARKGATKETELCAVGDLLVFDSRGYDNRNVAVAMARVCDVSSITMAGEKTSMVGICVYTGKTLTIANEYRGSKK